MLPRQEKEVRNISLDDIDKIATALGISLQELFTP